ncbi:MAG: signal peptidase I [bacterium]|nr:signal peptidase I [bacterium]
MKIFFKIIYYLFIACVAIIALFLIISIFPITGNFKVMVVQSGSMEPAIHTGSVVIVKPLSASSGQAADYKIGDIITFGPNTKTKAPTTHRINEVKNSNGVFTYITKGDANNAPDTKEIRKNEIIGKVLFSVPYVGYAVDAAKKPLGFAAIIILPAAIIIYDEAQKIWAEAKRMRKKKEESNTLN